MCRLLLAPVLSAACVAGIFGSACVTAAESDPPGSLVRNGGFEADADADGVPDGWAWAGDTQRVTQQLSRVPENGGFAARLECTRFEDGNPACHAMVCQTGVVSVRRGQWYRLTFRARATGIRSRVLQVALSDTRDWSNSGLADAVPLGAAWRRYALDFQAARDIPAEATRLQFWYGGTGTLWLDDVALVPTEMRLQRHPQLVTEGRTNFLPNSSFECGAVGWGCFAPDLLQYWYGNVCQQLGRVDNTTAAHGRHSLRLDLSAKALPTYYFDWFDPVRRSIRSLLAVHHGWAPVQPGQPYVVSAFLKADQPGRVGVLYVRQSSGRSLRHEVRLSTEWQRYEFGFTPEAEFLWVGAGGDLGASGAAAMSVWVDAVQLQAGLRASEYEPCAPVEVMAEPGAVGGIFAAAANGQALRFQVRAFNNTAQPVRVPVTLSATDFFDAPALRREVTLSVPARAAAALPVVLPASKTGFYRVRVAASGGRPHQELRCALLRRHTAPDSRFGMNHAYPWDFLLEQARQAGLRWWRDWSVQWRTVQPERGAAFQFGETDHQIDRVIRAHANALMLFPFPSSVWASTATPEAIAKLAQQEWERPQVQAAFRPSDEQAFAEYVRQSVRHYRGRVRVYQIFNEALFTTYALPAAGGHTVEDYVRLVRVAYGAIKAEQPDAIVLAGPGIWPDSHWARDFVEAGGLRYADALDVHLYPRGDPEFYAESLSQLWKRMQERGEAKPVWLTEVGCYADDDPAVTPLKAHFGDAAMRQSLHDTEREASEWLVKFCTLFFANGGARVFLHAGICGEINGDDTGSVFFEYGGAPRKMLAAVAIMAGLLPPEARFQKEEAVGDGVAAYWFATPSGRVGVAWSTDGADHPLRLRDPAPQVLDLMGNPAARPFRVGATPVYLVDRRRQDGGTR